LRVRPSASSARAKPSASVIAVTLPSGPRGPHVVLAIGTRRRYSWSMGFVTDGHQRREGHISCGSC
jgi:hypothetical protein